MRMQEFFRNNFAEERWRKAALKNAFALLGKQRFHHAAAFFLLAGAVRDAIEVCLHKLDDLQLAMVVAQLYESEEASQANLHRLLWEECLGCDPGGQGYCPQAAHPDPFVRSMAYWRLKDYSAALGTLLEVGLGGQRAAPSASEYGANPSVFNFYNYLRTHPLLVRQHLATTAADKAQTVLLSGFSHGAGVSVEAENNVTYVDCITPVERRLYFQTAHAHFKSGCPMLALEVLCKLPEVIDTENDITKSRSADSVSNKSAFSSGIIDGTEAPDSSLKQGVNDFDWSQPAQQTASSFDWGAPVTQFEDEKLELSFELEDDTDTKSDSEVESKDKLLRQGASEEGKGEELKVVPRPEGGSSGDIMAQQLKFVACLKIMMEEISTLATGELTSQIPSWLPDSVPQRNSFFLQVLKWMAVS